MTETPVPTGLNKKSEKLFREEFKEVSDSTDPLKQKEASAGSGSTDPPKQKEAAAPNSPCSFVDDFGGEPHPDHAGSGEPLAVYGSLWKQGSIALPSQMIFRRNRLNHLQSNNSVPPPE